MAEIAFLPDAEAEYAEAYLWYHERNAQAAQRFERAVENGLVRIADSPSRWTKVDDIHRIHLVEEFPYAIIYRTSGKDVVVIAVAHTRRKPGYWRERT